MYWNLLGFGVLILCWFIGVLILFFSKNRRPYLIVLVTLVAVGGTAWRYSSIKKESKALWRRWNPPSKLCVCSKFSMRLSKDKYTRHRAAAKKLPNAFYIKDNKKRKEALSKGVVVSIPSNPEYRIRKMNYGTPELHVEALKRFLELNQAFQQRLKAQGLPVSQLLVSSALRTGKQQKELGSVAYSAHSYGAAFDVSHIQTTASCAAVQKQLQEVLQEFQRKKKLYLCPESDHLHLTAR